MHQALDAAAPGPVAEGSVGAGTGTMAFGWKGGIGTASRVLPAALGGHGRPRRAGAGELRRRAADGWHPGRPRPREILPGGACRAAGRCGWLGGGRPGHGCATFRPQPAAPGAPRHRRHRPHRRRLLRWLGRLCLAFATHPGSRTPNAVPAEATVTDWPNDRMSPLFVAVAEAPTEEAVLNASAAAGLAPSPPGSAGGRSPAGHSTSRSSPGCCARQRAARCRSVNRSASSTWASFSPASARGGRALLEAVLGTLLAVLIVWVISLLVRLVRGVAACCAGRASRGRADRQAARGGSDPQPRPREVRGRARRRAGRRGAAACAPSSAWRGPSANAARAELAGLDTVGRWPWRRRLAPDDRVPARQAGIRAALPPRPAAAQRRRPQAAHGGVLDFLGDAAADRAGRLRVQSSSCSARARPERNSRRCSSSCSTERGWPGSAPRDGRSRPAAARPNSSVGPVLKCRAARFSTRAAMPAWRIETSLAGGFFHPADQDRAVGRNCRSAQVSSKKALMKMMSSSAIFASQAVSIGTSTKGRVASTRRPRSGVPSSATRPPRMKMLVEERKLVLFIRLPIAAMSSMRLSRSVGDGAHPAAAAVPSSIASDHAEWSRGSAGCGRPWWHSRASRPRRRPGRASRTGWNRVNPWPHPTGTAAPATCVQKSPRPAVPSSRVAGRRAARPARAGRQPSSFLRFSSSLARKAWVFSQGWSFD